MQVSSNAMGARVSCRKPNDWQNGLALDTKQLDRGLQLGEGDI